MTANTPRHAAGQDRAPLPPIKFDALARELLGRAESLCEQWLPGGVKRGHEYVCGSVRGGEGSSCSVNLTTGKWADFASGEKGGDLISLYAAGNDMDNGAAAIAIARDYGLEDVAGVQALRQGATAAPRPAPKPLPPPRVEKPNSDEGWTTVMPVPATAPAPTYWHPYRNNEKNQDPIGHLAEYRVDDALYGYVVRFVTSDGGKDTLPYTWCTSARDGASKWHWRGWDEPRPLYFPSHTLPKSKVVVLVEGEKKADILQSTLNFVSPNVYHVASWAGGANAWKKAAWDWLAGCHVLLWPDCDAKRERLTAAQRKACVDSAALDIAQAMQPLLPANKQPGMKAMLGIGAQLRDVHGCAVQMLKIPEPLEVPDGWDCADAIGTDGWTGERLLQFFGTASTLVASDSDSANSGASSNTGGKKVDGLVATGGADDAAGGSDGVTMIGGCAVPDWLLPYYNPKDHRWMVSRKMVILILENDLELQGILAYNELNNNIQSREKWPWAYAEVGDVTDAVDLLLGKYLTDKYGLPSIPRAALSEAIETVAHARRFHPIREYFGRLPVHDLDKDKSRIDNWLPHVLGETPETLTPAMLEYLQIVGRCWLLGMVNRVMQPGCKFDYCPVLEGVGGLRKSTMVEVLASTAFFSDTPFEVGKGKEAQEQVQGLWLYEIAEMTHFSKSEVGAIKAFITSKIDRYRVAYGKTVGTFPRQCVLVGTTNENTYLRDRTGNRRFWPVPVRHVINTEWLEKYRDALFAEAYALYQKGERFVPTPDQEKRLFVPMQESRLVETAVLSELLNVLTRPPHQTGIGAIVNGNANFVTIAQLTLALGVDAAKSSPALEAQIRGWLDYQGWDRQKKQINDVRAWGYVRPTGWPKDNEQDAMTAMTAAPTVAKPLAETTEDGDDVPF